MEDEKILLAEYRHFSESFWKNEEIGEKRVNFFITLTTAILAGIVALFTADPVGIDDNKLLEITIFALSGNLIFGLVTFLRILHRNKVTDEFKDILTYIRKKLKERSESLKGDNYDLPFRSKKKGKDEKEYIAWFRGGLAESVATMNSILFTVIIGIAISDWRTTWGLLLGVLLISGFSQLYFIRKRHKKKDEVEKNLDTRSQNSQWFRAGAGAVITNEQGEVLAFERRDIPGAWQLPQGGIDSGEEPLEAVYREIQEETGIKKEHLSLLSEKYHLLPYELPAKFRNAKTGRGQVQYWFLFKLVAADRVIGFGDQKEFIAWKWIRIENLANETVAFRKPVYEALVKFVADYFRF